MRDNRYLFVVFICMCIYVGRIRYISIYIIYVIYKIKNKYMNFKIYKIFFGLILNSNFDRNFNILFILFEIILYIY